MKQSSSAAVDVGVVTWNSADVVIASLRRLLDTDQGCRIRLLVRDNGSTDGTVDAIREVVPEAEVDAGRHNVGFAAGVNSLLSRSDAPWFFLMNPDAWPLPGAISTLVRVGHELPGAAAVCPQIQNVDGTLQPSTFPFPSLRIAALCAFRWNRLTQSQKDDLLLPGGWLHDRPRGVDWAIGAALLLRRSAVENIGAFNENYFMYVEDVEWCWRAHRMGWGVRFEPAAVVRHLGNASGRQYFGDMRTRAVVANEYRFYLASHGRFRSTLWWALNAMEALIRLFESVRARDRQRARHALHRVSAQVSALATLTARRNGATLTSSAPVTIDDRHEE